jgi:PAS domain S-box-containing protein
MTRILVAEDSATQLQRLELILQSEGFEVVPTHDGVEALERLGPSAPDLVLSDIVMPRMGGYELCRRIKELPHGAALPVVLLTSLSDPLEIFRGLEAGADSFITKPYAAETLIGRIRSILTIRRLRAAGKLEAGADLLFMGHKFTVRSGKEQILDLLVSSFEDMVRSNRELREREVELAEAKARLESYTHLLEDEVRLTDEKYWSLMERAGDAIFIMDPSGRILEANRQAGELLGMAPEQVAALKYQDLGVEGDRSERSEDLRRLLSRGSLRVDGLRLRQPGGQVRIADLSAALVGDEQRRLVIAIARDVTERKELERQLSQSQKLEAIGLLAGGIAHDFNNQLGVIAQYGEILSQLVEPDSPLRPHVEKIQKTVGQSAALTRQLLAFSRKQELQPVVLDLNKVVGEMGDMLQRLLGRNIELLVELEPELGQVRADPSQLGQVLMNLVVNARDAMPEGGLLTIDTSNVELDEQGAQRHLGAKPGPHVRLRVSDTGAGMDEATLARIFEPFFTTKEPGKGTGLGLATTFGIVQQSGGSISVQSEPGQGTRFEVYLPQVSD